MNLWFSSHFLVAGLFLCSSAPTPEECQPLITPLSLADRSEIYGQTNFFMGYTDNPGYNDILKVTESCRVTISPSPFSPNQAVMFQENSVGGKCFVSTVNITIDGNVLTTEFANVTSKFHLLPSCKGCLVYSINSTARNLDKFLNVMNISSTFKDEEVAVRALYLMGNETTLSDENQELFRKQASCLGFSREPDFVYDPKKGFCAEGKGAEISFTSSEIKIST